MSKAGGDVSQAEVESMVEVLFTGRRFEALAQSMSTLLEAYPDSSLLQIVSGALLLLNDDLDASDRVLSSVLARAEKSTDVIPKMVYCLSHIGEAQKAIKWVVAALERDPTNAKLHHAIGSALEAIGDLEQAMQSYKTAITLDKSCVEAYANLGNLLVYRQENELALSIFELAERQIPSHPVIKRNKAAVYQLMGRQQEAVEALTSAYELSPNSDHVLGQLLFRKRYICDWSNFPPRDKVEQLGLVENLEPVLPWSMLCLDDDESRQTQRAAIYARHTYSRSMKGYQGTADRNASKIRLGYFSADFYGHATMALIDGLLRLHAKERFEVFCFDYGSRRDRDTRSRLASYGCKVVDIHGVPDPDVVKLVHHHGIHIALDLNGYTAFSRTSLFALRVAPIQINYLAYPGPLAADFIDYIVADEIVMPIGNTPKESESVIFMPNCYQPNDNKREISTSPLTREQVGLPNDAVVLCCFNNNYKVSPDEFDIWMRVMLKVPQTVLWLLADSKTVEDNLLREASSRGVAAERILFAPRCVAPDHLARHRLADLFVDTFYVNAHTTASDALWAGLPVLTLRGNQFASRVAASILSAMELPELITHSSAEYESKLLELAANPGGLDALKQKVKSKRESAPLFDTAAYTRDFENGLEAAFERFQTGLPPADIRVR